MNLVRGEPEEGAYSLFDVMSGRGKGVEAMGVGDEYEHVCLGSWFGELCVSCPRVGVG